MSSNPLLEKSDLPNYAPPFDKIKVEHYMPAVQAAIEEARMHAQRAPVEHLADEMKPQA